LKVTQQTLTMMRQTGLSFIDSADGYAIVAVEKPQSRGPFAPTQDDAFTEWYWRGWAFRRSANDSTGNQSGEGNV
jgi:hypothetical protein